MKSTPHGINSMLDTEQKGLKRAKEVAPMKSEGRKTGQDKRCAEHRGAVGSWKWPRTHVIGTQQEERVWWRPDTETTLEGTRAQTSPDLMKIVSLQI